MLKKIIIIILCLHLCCCGFHLQQEYSLSNKIQCIALSGLDKNDPLLSALTEILDTQNIKISYDNPSFILTVNSATLNEQPLANNSKGQAVKIISMLTVSYKVEVANKSHANEVHVSYNRNINPNLPLSNEYEKELSLNVLYKKAAKQIIRQLSQTL